LNLANSHGHRLQWMHDMRLRQLRNSLVTTAFSFCLSVIIRGEAVVKHREGIAEAKRFYRLDAFLWWLEIPF